MAKIRRDEVVAAALVLLNEVGIEDLTTRRLADKLGIKSATLYWHFRDKAALLGEMAEEVMATHHRVTTSQPASEWPEWFAENARSFRRALLLYRDGARLHAGTRPGSEQVSSKTDYLMAAGFTHEEALMALGTTSHFTVGCVLEEQSHLERGVSAESGKLIAISAESIFEFGLRIIVEGLRNTIDKR
ncbi:TetR/AcrR family transcriptional regulator C-terminal domain-containing protein [Mesorhizobium sp. NPDC059054]|uniref:TetR/AcrR family transcriptional regulator C-terminal domain-containing protein n=1 Tax=Mesorhizobium sp. NPDC059054 TaxID=3346711 RepID=UPI0036C79DF5